MYWDVRIPTMNSRGGRDAAGNERTMRRELGNESGYRLIKDAVSERKTEIERVHAR